LQDTIPRNRKQIPGKIVSSNQVFTTITIVALMSFMALKGSAQVNQVTITKNKTTFIEYPSPGAGALLDEDNLMLEINNPDRKHSLVINLFPFGRQEYPLASEGEDGKAVVMLFSDKLMLPLTFDQGVLKIIKNDSGKISLSVKATIETNQDSYSMELELKNIPMKTI
jgi:hypothetical protein